MSGVWVLGQDALRSLLQRARDGEDIEALIVEQYANSYVEVVDGD